MKHIMCVHLKQWPIDRSRRRQSDFAHRPLVLVETIASRQLIAIASDEAIAHGIRPPMTLAQARALCPGLLHAPYTPDKDRHALEALARWLMRFTPVVSTAPIPSTGNYSIFLDVTGCQRLFGGLPNLIEQADEALRSMQFHARIAIAPTPGSAWAFAFAGNENGRIIPPDGLTQAIAPLPPIALRITPDLAQTLHHLGLETIGQLMQLPRDALPARFGPMLLTRLDQALGRIPEPLTPLPYQAPIEARIDFDGAVDSLEVIWLVFKKLIAQLIQDLVRRGCGARKIEITFFQSDTPPISKTILLSRPSRDPANLFNLMRCAMESLENSALSTQHSALRRKGRSLLAHASAPDSMIPAGFTAIHLRVPVSERVTDEQIPLLEQEQHDSQLELDHLIERLMLRLGDEAISQARLLQSYVPEYAYERGVRGEGSGVSKTGQSMTYPLPLTPDPLPTPRPLYLLSQPEEIHVMVCPSDDCDGRPISFTRNGQVYPVSYAIGPERIAGQWWQGHNKTRDYFAVEDPSGRRWWVFRVRETTQWYWHGAFE